MEWRKVMKGTNRLKLKMVFLEELEVGFGGIFKKYIRMKYKIKIIKLFLRNKGEWLCLS